ncbi:MAG TPA: hypothetical protein VLC46_26220 [Thermoanaerobaculia bacterium]|jgi:hypothetical protein|nr:hypothetical protein [Thermoanaerobaculia bacterium]
MPAEVTGFHSQMERGEKLPQLAILIRLPVALDCKPPALVKVFEKEDLTKLLSKLECLSLSPLGASLVIFQLRTRFDEDPGTL